MEYSRLIPCSSPPEIFSLYRLLQIDSPIHVIIGRTIEGEAMNNLNIAQADVDWSTQSINDWDVKT